MNRPTKRALYRLETKLKTKMVQQNALFNRVLQTIVIFKATLVCPITFGYLKVGNVYKNG